VAELKFKKLRANKSSFKEVEFTDGLNLILADRTEDATNRDSRNGVGKSTLIELLHFCLGSSVTKRNVIYQLRETDWAFTLDLRIGDQELSVRRSLDDSSRVVLWGATQNLPGLDAAKVSLAGEVQVSVKSWKDCLGELVFGIDERHAAVRNGPSFRSLIPYFARSGRDAYLDAFTTSRQIRSWQKQVYNAFLVGLNWRHAAEWQLLKDQENQVKIPAPESAAHKRANLASLENERARLVSDQLRLKQQVTTFHVVPEYAAIEEETRQITSRMRDLVNESAILSQMIARYEEQMSAESPGELDRVREIFSEAGLLFPDRVDRELSEVIRFHNDVTAHRREYLHNEITRLRSRSSEIKDELTLLDSQRADKIHLLNDGGAVEELGALQFRLGRTQERLEEVEKKIAELESVAAEEATVASGRQALLSRALLDRAERRPKWSTIISEFINATRYLYGEPGELNFGLNENGFTFETKMQRRGSNGVELMAIYAYDISLAQVWQRAENRPGFLLHDSLMFEGVDERQIALALRYGSDRAIENGFQYIAIINSDNLPVTDLRELGLDWEQNVRLRLGDADPSQTLLGFRFGQSG
jgi:uncharacterized protein YydD (DUF2326 family)